jgi:hypothetical protein
VSLLIRGSPVVRTQNVLFNHITASPSTESTGGGGSGMDLLAPLSTVN